MEKIRDKYLLLWLCVSPICCTGVSAQSFTTNTLRVCVYKHFSSVLWIVGVSESIKTLLVRPSGRFLLHPTHTREDHPTNHCRHYSTHWTPVTPVQLGTNTLPWRDSESKSISGSNSLRGVVVSHQSWSNFSRAVYFYGCEVRLCKGP